MNMIRRIQILVILGLSALITTSGSAENIELVGGAVIHAPLLVERSGSVVVDLGFQILDIPRDQIVKIGRNEGPASVEGVGDSLFRTREGQPLLSVEVIIGKVGEAVVQVRTPVGLGSGFLIHPDGYLITNQHVISGENRITVTVFRQTEHELEQVVYPKVRIVATQAKWDLALLKIEDAGETTFPVVPLAEPGKLQQGETVFAIGSPLGMDRSVARGIVSQKDRVLSGALYVQTTAAINPGNSGGPLFNLRGEVVGVNDLKLAGIGLEGLSFAIPVETLRRFINKRSAFLFDPRNPNSGFRYMDPPGSVSEASGKNH